MRRLAYPSRFLLRQHTLRPLARHAPKVAPVHRSYAKVVDEPDSTNPFDYLPSASSLLATSSQVTIETFPRITHRYEDDPDPRTPSRDQFELAQALDKSTDEDLIAFVLRPGTPGRPPSQGPREPWKREWQPPPTSQVTFTSPTGLKSPAKAFRALRRRPSYLHFLARLSPHLPTVWQNLASENDRVTLVADLILRFPDARLLHHCLNLDATSGEPFLTTTQQVIIFERVQPLIRSNRLLPLVRKAYTRLATACQRLGQADILDAVCDALFSKATEPHKDDILEFMTIVAFFSNNGHHRQARRLLEDLADRHYIVARIPEHSGSGHPLSDQLIVHTILLDNLLTMGEIARASGVAKTMVQWLRETFDFPPAYEALLQMCRTLLEARPKDRPTQFRNKLLLYSILTELPRIPDAPPLPPAIFDLIFQTVPSLLSNDPLVRLYTEIPHHVRPLLSARSIGQLIRMSLQPQTLVELSKDIPLLPTFSFYPYYRPMLMALAQAGCWQTCKHWYREWKGDFRLDARLVLTLVRSARKDLEQSRILNDGGVRSKPIRFVDTDDPNTDIASEEVHRPAEDMVDPFALEILADFASRSELSPEDRVGIAMAFVYLRLGHSAVRMLRSLDMKAIVPPPQIEMVNPPADDVNPLPEDDSNLAPAYGTDPVPASEGYTAPATAIRSDSPPDGKASIPQKPRTIKDAVNDALSFHMSRMPGTAAMLLLLARSYRLDGFPPAQWVMSLLCLNNGSTSWLRIFTLFYGEHVLPLAEKARFEREVIEICQEHALLNMIHHRRFSDALFVLRAAWIRRSKEDSPAGDNEPVELGSSNNYFHLGNSYVLTDRSLSEPLVGSDTPLADTDIWHLPTPPTVLFFVRKAAEKGAMAYALDGLYVMAKSWLFPLGALKKEAEALRGEMNYAIPFPELIDRRKSYHQRLFIPGHPELAEKMAFIRQFVTELRPSKMVREERFDSPSERVQDIPSWSRARAKPYLQVE